MNVPDWISHRLLCRRDQNLFQRRVLKSLRSFGSISLYSTGSGFFQHVLKGADFEQTLDFLKKKD